MAAIVRARGLPWLLLLVILAAACPRRLRAETPPEGSAAAGRLAPPKGIAELEAIEARVKRVAARVLPAIVAVRVGPTQGSGVVVGKQGFVLTAGHVTGKPGQRAVFLFPDGKTAKGETLGIHRRADAGLARITDEGEWPSVEMGRSEGVQEGAWCMAAGHPFGYQEGRPPVVRVGRVLRSQQDVIQTDCPLIVGDSGGPLFDLEGRVIGVNSRISEAVSMNFHVPVDVYQDHWDRLVKGEAWDAGVPGKNSAEVKAAFREAIAEAGACVVRVKCDAKDAALGTIVGPDGWVVTKASELNGRIVCHGRDQRQWEARVVGIHGRYDLAMLKIEARGLPSISWSDRAELAVGQWVAVPGTEQGSALAVGVVSVPKREIPPASGVLGVALGDADGGVRIVKILPGSAAQKAGLEVDDVITHLNGQPAETQAGLIAAIKRHRPGEVVRLGVRRGEETLEISATLTKIETPGARRRRLQNRSGMGISKRHDDFPTVLQHDTVLRPVDCGGPLVDLSGKVIGVNVARGGRTETYAVPADILLTLMYDLMSGRLAPPEQEPDADPHEGEPDKKPEPPGEPESGVE